MAISTTDLYDSDLIKEVKSILELQRNSWLLKKLLKSKILFDETAEAMQSDAADIDNERLINECKDFLLEVLKKSFRYISKDDREILGTFVKCFNNDEITHFQISEIVNFCSALEKDRIKASMPPKKQLYTTVFDNISSDQKEAVLEYLKEFMDIVGAWYHRALIGEAKNSHLSTILKDSVTVCTSFLPVIGQLIDRMFANGFDAYIARKNHAVNHKILNSVMDAGDWSDIFYKVLLEALNKNKIDEICKQKTDKKSNLSEIYDTITGHIARTGAEKLAGHDAHKLIKTLIKYTNEFYKAYENYDKVDDLCKNLAANIICDDKYNINYLKDSYSQHTLGDMKYAIEAY